MARKHHPDRQKTSEEKIKAEERFRIINTAYEILSDPEQRTEYDYMLDNPDQMYFHYYQYYRRRVSTKVDVRLVILSILLIISSIQYAGQWTSYNHALSYLLKDPKHRAKAKQLASAEGRLNISKYEVGRRLTRDELKEREEQLLRSILKETVELRGDCCRPSLKRVLVVRILFFPWTCFIWSRWMLNWAVKYWLLRRPYDEEAQIFVTRRRLKMSESEWDYVGTEQQAKFLSQKLWIKENYQKFLADQEEASRIRAAENTDSKRYRRYTKPMNEDKLQRKKLLLGVTGSVAAIKIPCLIEKLKEIGFEIRLIVTTNSLNFFSTDNINVPIYKDVDEWTSWKRRGDPVIHIELGSWADILLLAPLSANTMAKMAHGLADNLLTTLVRAWWFPSEKDYTLNNKPVYFAPAMNTKMWQHPFTHEQIERLTNKLHWKCIYPIQKTLICGDTGIGAMAEADDIVNSLKDELNRNLF
ncbi:DnaJ subfamily C member 25 isoform 3 [Schistosoma japonicum]|uniref:DnaJ subfamily C member 25 isoform 3 n=4 Tax=Schistosoma japonicum TaxID=6182 RepID=A0A4Z2DBB1_SCHJA|nr:DnaJ subfamily C member 25 isoform 3 [Schistosoma japonicum]